MIYQIRANLFFDVQDEAVDFYHDCELAFAKGVVVNPGTTNEEPCTIESIENHHDENPNAQCLVLSALTNQTVQP